MCTGVYVYMCVCACVDKLLDLFVSPFGKVSHTQSLVLIARVLCLVQHFPQHRWESWGWEMGNIPSHLLSETYNQFFKSVGRETSLLYLDRLACWIWVCESRNPWPSHQDLGLTNNLGHLEKQLGHSWVSNTCWTSSGWILVLALAAALLGAVICQWFWN